MTIEQLLDCSADEMEKFTVKQLLEYFEPYLDITRPERAAVSKARDKSLRRSKIGGQAALKLDPRTIAIMQQTGINLDDL